MWFHSVSDFWILLYFFFLCYINLYLVRIKMDKRIRRIREINKNVRKKIPKNRRARIDNGKPATNWCTHFVHNAYAFSCRPHFHLMCVNALTLASFQPLGLGVKIYARCVFVLHLYCICTAGDVFSCDLVALFFRKMVWFFMIESWFLCNDQDLNVKCNICVYMFV